MKLPLLAKSGKMCSDAKQHFPPQTFAVRRPRAVFRMPREEMVVVDPVLASTGEAVRQTSHLSKQPRRIEGAGLVAPEDSSRATAARPIEREPRAMSSDRGSRGATACSIRRLGYPIVLSGTARKLHCCGIRSAPHTARSQLKTVNAGRSLRVVWVRTATDRSASRALRQPFAAALLDAYRGRSYCPAINVIEGTDAIGSIGEDVFARGSDWNGW